MRILLTTPPNQYFNVTGFTLRMPAYNLVQLASLLKQKHEIRVLDNTINLLCAHDIYKVVKEFQPDVLGVSVPFGAYSEEVVRIAGKIKSGFPNMILIAGGRVVTFVPERFINAGFDYLVRGEGERTFFELIEHLSEKDQKPIINIKGIAYKSRDGNLKLNEDRPLINNLDELPFASREFFRKRYSLWGHGYLTLVEASRGCAYNCNFCSQPNFWKQLRTFSNERILGELELVKSQGFKEIIFIDDSFVADNGAKNSPEKMAALFEAMIRRDWDFRFGICLRADTICRNADLIKTAKKAGLVWVNVGFESYSANSLDIMNKGTSLDYNRKASDILRKNGIIIWGSHVFAYPKQSENDLKMTVKYGLKYSDFFRLTMFTPVEGSLLFEKLKHIENSPLNDTGSLNYFNCVLNDRKYRRKIMGKFIFGLLRYYLNYKTMLNAVYNKNRFIVLMTRKAYRGAVLFVIYNVLRRFKLK